MTPQNCAERCAVTSPSDLACDFGSATTKQTEKPDLSSPLKVFSFDKYDQICVGAAADTE